MNTPIASPYAPLFQELIFNSLHYLRERVLTSEGLLPDELRRQALHTLSRYAFRLSAAWPLTRDLLLLLAPRMEQAGLRDEWMPFLARGISQCQAESERVYQGWFHFHLAVLCELRARYDEAETQFVAGAACFAESGDRRQQAVALSRAGFVVALQGGYARALQLVHDAQHQLPANDSALAYVYSTLGLSAYGQQQWLVAHDCFQNALQIWQAEQNPRQIARALRNVGPALRQLKRFTEAIHCYEQAIACFDTLPDPREAAVTRMNLGNVYLETAAAERALVLYHGAEPVLQAYQDDLHLARLYFNCGLAHQELHQWSAAEAIWLTSLQRWQQIAGQRPMVVTLLLALGKLYKLQSRQAEAYAMYTAADAQLAFMKDDPAYATLRAELRALGDDGQDPSAELLA